MKIIFAALIAFYSSQAYTNPSLDCKKVLTSSNYFNSEDYNQLPYEYNKSPKKEYEKTADYKIRIAQEKKQHEASSSKTAENVYKKLEMKFKLPLYSDYDPDLEKLTLTTFSISSKKLTVKSFTLSTGSLRNRQVKLIYQVQ